MAYGTLTLSPGVKSDLTPLTLKASFAQSGFIRFRDGMVQKMGGWTRFYPTAINGVPRELHPWEDVNGNLRLGVGSVGSNTQLSVITAGVVSNLTPQTLVSNVVGTISTTINSAIVTITDSNITNVTVVDSVYFNVPVSVGGLILDSLYPITQITAFNSYQITVPTAATATSSTDNVPVFTTFSGSSSVSVAFPNHGLSVGDIVVFAIATTVGGVTVSGSYDVASVPDANDFTINVNTLASSSTSASMNGGTPQLLYYITQGPPPTGSGYGLGGYGLGGFGTGVNPPNQTGTQITATDWTSDNYGQIYIACPQGGGIYFWDPSGGFTTTQIIQQGPPYNNGIFVSMAQQILIAYGSSVHEGIGWQLQPLLVQWSDSGNFQQWTPLTTNQAGNFVIPTGSKIVGGMAVANQNFLWTDLDLWAMSYIGPPLVYSFNKIGAGAGLISSHGAQQFRGSVYWMGPTNFYSYTSNGAAVMPCPVWDSVFQNLNPNFTQNVRAMPNTPYNEVGWVFPSKASVSGENDSYIKFNVVEGAWDIGIGLLNRSAWTDQSVLGPPIGATSPGIIYQHETSPNADGQPISASFTTGFFYISEAEDFVFVDQFLPDARWSTYPYTGTSAQLQWTFNVTNYPGDTPISYGPYTTTQATEFLSTRFRGRLISINCVSSDLNSFWRLGSPKFRFALSGRR